MKFKDLKISSQLTLGLGAIFALTALLGALAWRQTGTLWAETEGLYNHPLTVRRALGELKSDVLTIHISMKDLVRAETEPERQDALAQMAVAEANAESQFLVLYSRYLGEHQDIDEARNAWVLWKAVRVETVRLLRSGRTAEAIARTQNSGKGAQTRNKILDKMQVLSDFAIKRGDAFYAAAQAEKNSLHRRLALVLGGILGLMAFLAYYLLQAIRQPLAEIGQAAQRYSAGDLGARSSYAADNEFGLLSASFNSMAETVQAEVQRKERALAIAKVMQAEDEPRAFCRALLAGLLEHTGAQAGAVYLLNSAKTEYEHFESIGLGSAARAAFSAEGREGELGAAMATRRIQHLADIPADARFAFLTVTGEFRPRAIITIPVLSGQEVSAVVTLACVRPCPPAALQLAEDSWGVMNARFNSVLTLLQLKRFSERLEQQNLELDAQKKELTAQKDEMNEYNIELEMQKKQVDEASRLKSAFLSNMSHELRTPLNSVIALTSVLGRRLADKIPAEEYGYLDVIERNGKHLLEIINDILDLSRIEAGREDISVRLFPVGGLVREVVELLTPQASAKGLVLSSGVPDGLPPISSDFEKCRHILQNLVGNAIKFTGAGSVKITAALAGAAMEIKVADTGIGIAADKLHFIFEEFRQAEETTTRTYGGSGLGLAIARKYATLLQGSIAVESEPGKGSVFTLRLPLALNPAAAAGPVPVAPARPQALPGGGGKCVLVVEDSEPAVIQLKDILEGQGYTVRAARNGREALEQIALKVPDAMILDLMMPEVDGFAVLKAVRGTEKTSSLPVIILTAKHVSRQELSFLKGNHIHQLIQKGDIDRTGLLAAVGQMVAPPAAPAPRAARKPVAARASGKPLLLLVEDNPDNRLTVKAVLEKTYEVIEAADGKAGVEQARARLPDVILMDISLPVMDGIAAFTAIRSEDALKHIPIIALTARAVKGDREEILKRGFDAYISKPVDRETLERTLKETLHGGK